jgi:hypothetical protein
MSRFHFMTYGFIETSNKILYIYTWNVTFACFWLWKHECKSANVCECYVFSFVLEINNCKFSHSRQKNQFIFLRISINSIKSTILPGLKHSFE